MPRKTTKPKHASPPPDASLLGIPPEMRNAIYQLVAGDIDEVSIIGRKLEKSEATSSDHTWLWDAMAKHPLSQTCGQLRQEFDPVHRHRALTTGVAQYRVELEDYDVDRIDDFVRSIGIMPKVIQNQMKKSLDCCNPIIRFNLTDNIFVSIAKLKRDWRGLHPTFSGLQRALDVQRYNACRSYEINLNVKDQTMTSARRQFSPTLNLVAAAKKEMKKTSEDIFREFSGRNQDYPNVCMLEMLYEKLEGAYKNHFRLMQEAREEKASKASKSKLRAKSRDELKAELRDEITDELKAELRAEIMDELKAEAETQTELEK